MSVFIRFSFPLGMTKKITLLLLLASILLATPVHCDPIPEHKNNSPENRTIQNSSPENQKIQKRSPENRNIQKRSIFGLSAFLVSVLNTVLAISLNTSINRQNDAHGGIIG